MRKILNYYHEKLRKKRYFPIYAILAQLVIVISNAIYLIDYNMSKIRNVSSDLNYIIFIVVPTFLYFIFNAVYYDTYKFYNNRDVKGKFLVVVSNTAIIANFIYFVISIIDYTSTYYYLITIIVQTITTFYAFNFLMKDSVKITNGIQFVIFKIFLYASLITAILGLYYMFVNILVAWAFIIINSILLMFVFMLYNNYYKAYRKGHAKR